ncbi:hypothetical protein F2P81_020263 [Scophthalmus maximus]|uniref:Uncharacterized protein n=1 Tax=Scophthalmus maximus TaxID=52904 RepID=A0A6A4S8Q8_SCOMX|nr:hypothetical protein F2P81_020263 [Scophthalmus maximus]
MVLAFRRDGKQRSHKAECKFLKEQQGENKIKHCLCFIINRLGSQGQVQREEDSVETVVPDSMVVKTAALEECGRGNGLVHHP